MTAQSATTETNTDLPAIPNKRYFTIGEVGTLCDVKSHVLRYWEQEFSQLKPIKRRGNRRYYQRHDIELIRLIRSLLYDQGFTIAGARQQLSQIPRGAGRDGSEKTEAILDTRERIRHEQIDRQHRVLGEAVTADDDAPAEQHASPAVKTKHGQTKPGNLTEIRLALEAILDELAPYRDD